MTGPSGAGRAGFLWLAAFLALSAVVLVVDALVGMPAPAPPPPARVVTIAGRATVAAAPAAPGSGLSRHEIAHMRYMREEEKLAHDVYQLLADHWGDPVFARIAQAEQRHTDAVLGLLVRYGVPDPAAGNRAGQFTDPGLAALYAELADKGRRSPADAWTVGGLIEEVDIADLENATASTTRPDIIHVYRTIHRGSRNHLRAFAGALARNGIPYRPQKLAAAEVQAIVASPMENGPPP